MRISDWTSDVCSSDLKVSYFLAGCYAVRRAAVETCGGYRPEMKYGEEELDLSYRLIAAGYDIVYEPGIVAYHWPEPSAVKSAQQGGPSEIYYQVQDRKGTRLKPSHKCATLSPQF